MSREYIQLCLVKEKSELWLIVRFIKMSWLWAKPKTDADLLEKSMNEEDEKYYSIMIEYFTEKGYSNELKILKKYYPDTIPRFITGYAHCKEREKDTKEKILHFLNTYRKYKFDTILDNKDKNEIEYVKAWPLFAYGNDKYGHPVYYDCVGDASEDTIKKIFEINDITDDNCYTKLMTYKYTFMQRLHNAKRIQSEKHSKIIYKHVLIFDVKNVYLSYSQFTGVKAQFAKKVIGSDQLSSICLF